MRIISQDKEKDIPYEQAVLVISNGKTIYIDAYVGGGCFYLGAYHSLSDAKTVLRAAVAHKKAGRDYYELPQSDEDLEYAYRVM